MALLARVEALESENAALRAENADLSSRLNLNSKTGQCMTYCDRIPRSHEVFPSSTTCVFVRVCGPKHIVCQSETGKRQSLFPAAVVILINTNDGMIAQLNRSLHPLLSSKHKKALLLSRLQAGSAATP